MGDGSPASLLRVVAGGHAIGHGGLLLGFTVFYQILYACQGISV